MPAFRKNKPGAGRPPILNEELIAKICNVLRTGAYVETACVVSGVSKAVFYQWCKLANEVHPKEHPKSGKKIEKNAIYRKFLDAVEVASEEATLRDLMVIDKAANGADGEFMRDDDGKIAMNARGAPIMKKHATPVDWSAAAWRLERRRPTEWSKTEKVDHTSGGKEIGPSVVVMLPPKDAEPDNG